MVKAPQRHRMRLVDHAAAGDAGDDADAGVGQPARRGGPRPWPRRRARAAAGGRGRAPPPPRSAGRAPPDRAAPAPPAAARPGRSAATAAFCTSIGISTETGPVGAAWATCRARRSTGTPPPAGPHPEERLGDRAQQARLVGRLMDETPAAVEIRPIDLAGQVQHRRAGGLLPRPGRPPHCRRRCRSR